MNLSNQAFKGWKIDLLCRVPNFRETQKDEEHDKHDLEIM